MEARIIVKLIQYLLGAYAAIKITNYNYERFK